MTATTAPAATVAPASQNLAFTLEDMYIGYDAVQFPDEYLDRLRVRLASGAYLPIVYRGYIDSTSAPTQGNTHHHSYNIASSSINAAYCVLREHDYASSLQFPVNTENFVRGGESLISAHYRFAAYEESPSLGRTDATLRWQARVNNVQHPQYPGRVSDALQRIAYMSSKDSGFAFESRQAFYQAFAIFPLLLSMPDESVSMMAGYDSRGVSSTLSFDFSGLTSGARKVSTMILDVSRELRISAGRSCVVVY
eukprot:5142860-Pleurochrysis_carterae.AAC.1